MRAGNAVQAPARRSWLDRALGRVGLQRAIPAPSAARRGSRRRVYHAAEIDRLTAELFAQTLSANDELKGDLRRLRGLSRRLTRDTALGGRYPKLISEQTLGATGIGLQSRVERRIGGLNRGLNWQLEDSWKRWGAPGTCTMDGRLSWLDVQLAVLETMAVDGEALVRKVKGAPNPWGFAVQLIDIDLLDEQFTARLLNGNDVIMGVEVNSHQRPVAYHLWNRHPSESAPDRVRQRVLADEIEHLFLARRVQTRAQPWATPILLDAGTFAAFLEAAVHAARVGASRIAAVERDKDSPSLEEDHEYTTLPDEVGPAQVWDLEPGSRLATTNWQYPTGEIDPFSKIITRSIASGWNVAYATLTGDLSEANYSSIRTGVLQEREFYKRLQRLLVDRLCWPVYRAWRDMAIIAGEIPARVNLRDYDRVTWQVRGWPWVDPLKDGKAHTEALGNLLTTRRMILAEQGLDLEEVLEGLAEEQDMIKRLKLTSPLARFGVPAKTATPAEPAAAAEDEEEDTEDDDARADARLLRRLA